MSGEIPNCSDVNEEESVNVKTLCNKEAASCSKDADLSDNSEELFSDEEVAHEVNLFTPVQSVDDCSFFDSIKTPVLHSSVQETSPGRAVVPNTPLSLAPFISKINEPWTSELETPDAKLALKAQVSSTDRAKCLGSVERTNKQHTPVLENIKSENTESLSPVLTNKKRKRPKRQIFKSNPSENPEIPQNLENLLQDEESSLIDETIRTIRVAPLSHQPENSANSSDAISTLDSENSSPKCLVSVSNILPEINIKLNFSEPSTSCSLEKSLGDIVRKAKLLQKKERRSSQIIEADISENDFLKGAIQLECASKRFSSSVKQVPQPMSELGLVPFSQFFKEMGEKSATEESYRKTNPKNDQKEEDVFKRKEDSNEKEDPKEKYNVTNVSKGQSTISKTVKIFNQKLQKISDKLEGTSENSSKPVIPLKEESKEINDLLKLNDEDEMDLNFSQWLYESKDVQQKGANENTETPNSEKELSQVKDKDIGIVAEFDKKPEPEDLTAKGKIIQISEDKLQKAKATLQDNEDFDFDIDITEKIGSQDLKKSPNAANTNSNLLSTKPISVESKIKKSKSATISCGFSTAKGKNIKISRDKLQKAGMIYKGIENIESVLDFTTEDATKIPNGSNPISELEKNIVCGFATASGKSISISEQKLMRANKMYDEIQITYTEKYSPGKENRRKSSSSIESASFASSSKSKTPMKIDLLNKCTSGIKRKLLEEDTMHSKKFRLLDVGVARNSLSVNKNLLNRDIVNKGISKVPVENRAIDFSNEELQNVESVSKCDFIVAEVGRVQSGFATVSGKSIAIHEEKLLKAKKLYENIDGSENLVKAGTSKSVDVRRNFSLPVSFENKESLEIKQRRSLQTQFYDKNRNVQQINEDKLLKNNLLIKTSTSRSIESLVSNPLESESPPFYGFSFNEEEEIKLNDRLITAQTTDELIRKMRESQGVLNAEVTRENEELKKKSSKISVVKSKSLEEKESSSKFEMPMGFSTASGRKICINKNALSKANLLLSDENISDSKFTGLIPNKNNANSTPKIVYPQEEALSKELELLESFPDKVEPGTCNRKSTSKPLLKRSIKDVDGDTPLGRYDVSRSKKPKLNLDLQARKLFSEDSSSDGETEKNSCNKSDQIAVYSSTKSTTVTKSDQTATSASNKSSYCATSNQPTTSLSNQSQELASKIFSLKTATSSDDILNTDPLVSEEFFEPFLKDLKNSNDTKQGFKLNIEDQEENEGISEDVRRSPILGKTTKHLKKRRTKIFKSVNEESENTKEENFDSDVNTDSMTSSQTLETESAVDESDILENRVAAAFALDNIISRKKTHGPRPIKGSFLHNRDENQNSRVSLSEFANGSAPMPRSLQELKEKEIDPDVLEISASTAGSYKFRIADINRISKCNKVRLEVGDGATLVFDESGSAGVTEFESAFESSPGVNPRLLPQGWVRNHYRWIVWKLASMDRIKLGSADIPRMLTPDRVMKDLKYRYDREIDRSQRPAIRKMLEKDDVPSKRMVLCIAAIMESSENEIEERDPRILLRTPRWKVEVTDGWYSLPVSFDTAMVKNIVDGKVQEGTKIVTYGAELLNCDQGCFPLEKPADVCLKIHTNSTRRARWDVKLGYQPQSGPIPSSLKAINPNGGLIGKVSVVISRIYPILYREKTSDGQSIYRNARNEEKATMAYEQECQSKAEAIYAEAQKRLEGQKHDSSEEDSAESLSKYDSFSGLSESQRRKLLYNRQAKEERLKQKVEQELKANLPPLRQVVSVQKVRIVEEETSAILTIWSKSDEINILKEGGCFSIFNINSYGKRNGELHLTASRQAIFKSEPTVKRPYPSRVHTPLQDIDMPGFDPPYGELDTVGVVSWIGNTPHGMKNFEAVCLSCPNEDSSSSTYLSILFWQGISSYGFSNILTVGSLIACSNLEIRRTPNASSIPLCYCSERTVFTRNPRQAHLLSAFEALKKQISNPKAYAKTCGEEISSLIQKKSVPKSSYQGTSNSTPLPSDRSSGFNSPHFTMAKTPLDFDTPVKSSATQKRISKLAMYGQPPDLTNIVFNNSSNVRSNFRPVIRTPDTAKSTKIPPDST